MDTRLPKQVLRQRHFEQLSVQVRRAREDNARNRLHAQIQRLQEIEAGALNPYKTDFRAFLRDCCWTKDEAKGGNCAHVPDWPLFDELAEALIVEPRLFIEKSRRVMASWVVCCFDLWLAGGGRDPRWPTLMLGDGGNRQILVASRKQKGPGGSSWFLRSRIKFIYDEFEKRARPLWPDFPRILWTDGLARASNGSEITAVAQGADQLRGPGATFVHLEELAFWEQAQSSVEGTLPVVRGGGHVVAITTPNAASYAKRVRDGRLRDPGWT